MNNARTVFRLSTLQHGLSLTGRTLRLMVGVGDYSAYVEHMRTHHPELPVMDYAGWYRNRVDARYGAGDGKVSRCPC